MAEKRKEPKTCHTREKKTMRVYEFEWGHHSGERFLMEINAEARVVEKLLDEYRHKDPDSARMPSNGLAGRVREHLL